MKAKKFIYPIVIKENHLDSFGHVNNASYLFLFEEARWDLLTQSGFGLEEIHKSGFGPVILELKLSFKKELRLREKIIIETEMISYKNKICKMLQKMIRGDVVCAEAELVMGLFDLKKRKLVLPTPEWLSAMGVEN